MKKLRLTRDCQERFVEALAETGNVTAAVRVSGTEAISQMQSMRRLQGLP